MRLLRILLVLAGAAIPALAQTNPPQITSPYGAPLPTLATNLAGNIRQLSLQDCIQQALQHNIGLQISRYNPELALYNLKASYGPYDPALSFTGEHQHDESGARLLSGGFGIPASLSDSTLFNAGISGLTPIGTTYNLTGSANDTFGDNAFVATNTIVTTNGSGSLVTNVQVSTVHGPFENSSGQVLFQVTQPLLKNLWIDSTRLTIQVNKNRLKYSELDLKSQVMKTITTLEQAYFDLIYDRENVIVQQKAVELAERLVMENRKKLEVGTLAPLDLQSAEAQAAQSRASLIAAQSQLGTQERTVKQLITDHYSEWVNFVLEPTGTLTAPPPILNLQDSWSKGLNMRPDILQARLDVEKAGIQLKYNYNQLFPQLDAIGSIGYNGNGTEFSDYFNSLQQHHLPVWSFGGQISLPLSNVGPRNNYKVAKASMEQVILTLKQLEETTMLQIDNDVLQIRANYDQVQSTRAARVYEEAALDAEQKKLENGKSTTYTVLQVQRDLTNARGTEIQALDNYNKSLSQLSLDEGTTLDRLGIRFELK